MSAGFGMDYLARLGFQMAFDPIGIEKPFLKRRRILSQIVPETGQPGPLFAAKRAGEFSRQLRNITQVFFQWLPFMHGPVCQTVSIITFYPIIHLNLNTGNHSVHDEPATY
jgi:hypothetical protein